jgi:hypothetical protein
MANGLEEEEEEEEEEEGVGCKSCKAYGNTPPGGRWVSQRFANWKAETKKKYFTD